VSHDFFSVTILFVSYVDCFNNVRDEDNLIYESMLLIKCKFEVTHKGWYLRGLDVTFIPINSLLSINIIC